MVTGTGMELVAYHDDQWGTVTGVFARCSRRCA
jgi:hypothetical protein